MNEHLNRNGYDVKTLILGMGNEFLGDAGAGIHAVRAMLREGCPKNTEAFEFGASTMEALIALQRADRVIIVDALRAHGKPGTIYRVPLVESHTRDCIASPQSLELFRVLNLSGCLVFLEVILFGIEPAVIDSSKKLSKDIADALPLLLEIVRAEIEGSSAQQYENQGFGGIGPCLDHEVYSQKTNEYSGANYAR